MQLRKESMKKFRLVWIQTLTSAIPVHCSNQLSYVSLASQRTAQELGPVSRKSQ